MFGIDCLVIGVLFLIGIWWWRNHVVSKAPAGVGTPVQSRRGCILNANEKYVHYIEGLPEIGRRRIGVRIYLCQSSLSIETPDQRVLVAIPWANIKDVSLGTAQLTPEDDTFITTRFLSGGYYEGVRIRYRDPERARDMEIFLDCRHSGGFTQGGKIANHVKNGIDTGRDDFTRSMGDQFRRERR